MEYLLPDRIPVGVKYQSYDYHTLASVIEICRDKDNGIIYGEYSVHLRLFIAGSKMYFYLLQRIVVLKGRKDIS